MADETPEATPAPAAPKAKGGGVKTMMVLALVLGLEGGTIALTMWLTGGPREVSAIGLESDQNSELNKIVEVLVVKDRFPNLRTGRHFLYDTEVYITVKARHQGEATAALEAMQAQIKTQISTLIRKAEPEWFQEATLSTLRRQIKESLDQSFEKRTMVAGKTPAGEGEAAAGGHSGASTGDEPIIQDVLITKCIPFRADF